METLLLILMPILIQIESSGDPNAIGDNGEAVGSLQIHRIYVREVNRILGENRFTYADRNDTQKSVEMAKIHIGYWSPKNMEGTFLEKLVILGRIHNGGPNGEKKDKTLGYGEKIKKLYKQAYKSGFKSPRID
tara:strand:+ start:5671 stop:6069 length:399 start_codon:yes stop_codon:yes gene_type:complete